MLDKIGGVGIVNIIVIGIILLIANVGLKAILTAHPVNGLSQIIQAN